MRNANMLPRIRLADADVANASYKITDDVLARSLSSLLEGNKEGERGQRGKSLLLLLLRQGDAAVPSLPRMIHSS